MADPAERQIERIRVRKLFGLYDHEIPLNLAERVTILHGPNGVGKTWLLRLLAALFAGDLSAFEQVPFERFEVVFRGGDWVAVEPKSKLQGRTGDGAGSHVTLEFSGQSSGANVWTEQVKSRTAASRGSEFFPDELPRWLAPIDRDHWLDTRTDQVLSRFDLRERYGSFLSSDGYKRRQLPARLTELGKQVRVHFIETQRLLRVPSARGRGPELFQVTVLENARDLHDRVKEVQADYARRAQRLEQSFPLRLMDAGPALAFEELQVRLTELDARRARLRELGLLDDSNVAHINRASLEGLNESQRTNLSLYVQDTEERLSTLDDLARRMELFRDYVNNKFKNKSLRLSREQGFVAIGHDNTRLGLDALSSGEQHQLVLLYDLLFRVAPNSLVLIDEPELSMHLSWQRSFLLELLDIVRAARFDVLLATHSPFIVGDHTDLMVPLDVEVD